MKINRKEIMIGHKMMELIVVNGLVETLSKDEFNDFIKDVWEGSEEVDIQLTIGGVEIDFKKVVDLWQGQVKRMVREEAEEIVKGKFVDVQDILEDLERRLEPEIKSRLDDWEKDN